MKNKLAFITVLFLWLIFSAPYFAFNKTPFPSDFQSSFYSPWRQYNTYMGPVKNNAMPDIITQIYPWRHFTVQELKQGRIPLWNPYSFSGTPHLANYQSAVFSPMNILFFIFDFRDAWTILVLLQPLLAGIGMVLFLRQKKLSQISQIAGAVSFMYSSFMTTWMGYSTLSYAAAMLPFAFYALEKIRNEKYRYVIFMVLVISFSFLSGHFQTSVYIALASLLYSFNLFWNDRKKLIYSLVSLASGIAVAAPQIVPSLEMFVNAPRSGMFQSLEIIPWSYIPTILSPDFFGNPVTRNDWLGHYAEWGSYAGTMGMFLMLVTLFHKFRKYLFFFLMFSLSLLLAFESPLSSLIVALKVPFFATSAASRIILLASFCISVLAAAGVQIVIGQKIKKVPMFLTIFTSFVILLVLWLVVTIGIVDPEKTKIARNNLILPSLSIAAGLIGVVIAHYLRAYKKIVILISLAIVGVLSFEMLRFTKKWMPYEEKSIIYAQTPVNEFFNKISLENRVLTDSTAEVSVYYRVPGLSGYDPLYPARYGEFVKFIDSGEYKKPDRSTVSFPNKGKHTRLAINMLGVDYILHKTSDTGTPWGFPLEEYEEFTKEYDDGIMRSYRNPNAVPRVYLARKIVSSQNELEELFEQNETRIAILDKSTKAKPATDFDSIKILSYLPGEIIFASDAKQKSIAVVTDNFLPGWKAEVNGVSSEVLQINHTFKGVEVPEGNSKIRLSYQPDSFKYGILISVLTILGISLFSLTLKNK